MPVNPSPTTRTVQSYANSAARRAAIYGRDSEQFREAKREHAAAALERYITQIVDAAPPLTEAQTERLAALLRGGCAR